MPRNAIAAGIVDFVLHPAHIANELARIGKHPLIVVAEPGGQIERTEQAERADQAELYDIFRMLRMSSGIDFSNYKLNTIRRRISRRMVVTKVEALADYTQYLKKNAAELDALAGDLLINVTSFFRDQEIFDLLKANLLPELLKQKGTSPLRVWVPGCSTGEEAYSLAICMLECCAEMNLRVPIQIFATDISEWTVERARVGIYPESIAAEVSKERLRRFFTKVESGYQVSKTIRDVCVFARQDLAKDPPFSRMDLISCRNVLIYLAPVLQKKIIPTFHYALNPDGVLILGSSETIGGFADLFMLMDKKYKIYRKKQAVYRVSPDFQLAGYDEKQVPGKKAQVEMPGEFDVQKEADRMILASYAPAAVLINEHMDILQFRGRTGNFIEPMSGSGSLNLMKMLREGLLLEVRALVLQAKKQNVPVHKREVILHGNCEERRVNLDVVPVRPPDQKKPHFFLVIFRDSAVVMHAEAPKAPTGRKRELRDFELLRTDLQNTREYLQATLEEKDSMNEEFRAAVEEIQSSNEELQSTNEELETAKEELQSTNEELITVNEELQTRNAELTQVNNDLSNLLNNVSFPVVMLTTDLRIRRFTPMAEKILNFIPSDVGRPFSDLRLRIDFPNLEGLIHEVIDTLVPKELEVQDAEGRWYQLRIRPYMTLDKKIDGVVIALLDISDMKLHLESLRQAQEFANAIVESMPGPFLILSTDLIVEQANRAFYERFRVTQQETEGNFLFNLGNGQWNIPALRKLLEKVLQEDGGFERFEVSHEFPSLGKRHMLLNGRKIYCAEGNEKILLAFEEKQD
ncbi:CheR family methyltransferase [Geobacter sp. DSM 9736]|uniref:CheR family methyltransferase n=1 Tax=Geobacter sp. DSM 9736 TaxID=1277350 RepID=UPI003518EC54